MIGPQYTAGGPPRGFGALSLMRFLEKELARKQGKPSAKAQDLFCDAMEANTDEEEFELLQQVFELDPGNVDVLLALLRHLPVAIEDEIELLQKIVELAERRPGAKAFKEYAGHFWVFIETRAYMRARQQLAKLLHHCGRIEEAIVEFEAIIELNSNDNQGVRYELMTCYLESNRMEGAARLPRHLPDGYSPGSREEAICFADTLQPAWKAHPRALEWLKDQSEGRRGRGK